MCFTDTVVLSKQPVNYIGFNWLYIIEPVKAWWKCAGYKVIIVTNKYIIDLDLGSVIYFTQWDVEGTIGDVRQEIYYKFIYDVYEHIG